MLGFFHLLGGQGEYFEPTAGVACHHGQGDGNGQTNHAGAGDAYAHGILEYILTKAQVDVLGFVSQRLDSLAHTEGHGPGLCAARGQDHLLPQQGIQLLADAFFHD